MDFLQDGPYSPTVYHRTPSGVVKAEIETKAGIHRPWDNEETYSTTGPNPSTNRSKSQAVSSGASIVLSWWSIEVPSQTFYQICLLTYHPVYVALLIEADHQDMEIAVCSTGKAILRLASGWNRIVQYIL